MAVNEHHATIQELHVEIAVLKVKNDEREKALIKQAIEYERRLNDLNHAHAQAQEVQNTYLPREIHEKAQSELRIWQIEVAKQLDQTSARKNTLTSLGAIAMALAALGISAWGAFFQ